ncbi:MAG: hypothetical protein HYS12_00935 [Planctomycetes bacterium]|nr:hypothetical protein [Planctomycetota bacterium]
MHDPIVEEIRKVREAYSARFNHDLDAMYEDIRKQEELSGRTFIQLPPRKARSIRWNRRRIAPVEEQTSEQAPSS